MAAASAGYGYPHAPCPLLLCVVCGLLALMMDSVDSNNLIIICKLFRKAAGNNVMADNGMLDPEQYHTLSILLPIPVDSDYSYMEMETSPDQIGSQCGHHVADSGTLDILITQCHSKF